MTPCNISAFAFLAGRRREREMSQMLSIVALGAQGESDTIKKQIEDWEKDQ